MNTNLDASTVSRVYVFGCLRSDKTSVQIGKEAAPYLRFNVPRWAFKVWIKASEYVRGTLDINNVMP